MDIATYNTVRAFAEASIRERNFKPDPSKFNTIPAGASRVLSGEEKDAVLKQRAEMDKHAAETRASVIKQTGRDPLVPDKVDRTPMTEEAQATYVQAWMARFEESDAKIQQLRQMEQQWLSRSLAKTAQGSLVDVSA